MNGICALGEGGAGQVSVQQECLVYYRMIGIPDPYPLNKCSQHPSSHSKKQNEAPSNFQNNLRLGPVLLPATALAIPGAIYYVITHEIARSTSFLQCSWRKTKENLCKLKCCLLHLAGMREVL